MTATARPMTADERAFLEGFLSKHRSRLKTAVENFLVGWAAYTLCFVLVWAVAAWLGHVFLGANIGWKSSLALWVLPAAVRISAVVPATSTVKWLRGWTSLRPQARADLAGGVGLEERLVLTDVKRFQEPEHGGLMYFLHSSDDRVFVLFDYESQQLGASGEDPLASSLRPRSELLLVHAPGNQIELFWFTAQPIHPAGTERFPGEAARVRGIL